MRQAGPYRLWKRGNYFYYRLASEKRWRSTGRTTRADANRYIIEQVLSRPETAEASRRPAALSFRQYAEPYFRWSDCPHIRRLLDVGRSYTRRTAAMNRRWLEKYVFTDPLADRPFREITRAELIDFRSRLLKALGQKKNTVNKVMGVVKTIFKEAVQRQDLANDPSPAENIRETRRQPDTFTLQELQLLFPTETLGPWKDLDDHTCFLLGAATGMRRAELLALRWEQLHLQDGYILVDRAWKGVGELGAPKWDHVRAARIALFRDRVEDRLQQLKEHSLHAAPGDFVFCEPFGRPFGFTWFSKRFRAAMKKFDPDSARRLSPHGLRHSLASLLRFSGKDPALIRASLGWYEERTQQRYEHVRPEDLAPLSLDEPEA